MQGLMVRVSGGVVVRVLLIFNKTSGTAKKDQILPDLLNM